jgi:hypothetical protein
MERTFSRKLLSDVKYLSSSDMSLGEASCGETPCPRSNIAKCGCRISRNQSVTFASVTEGNMLLLESDACVSIRPCHPARRVPPSALKLVCVPSWSTAPTCSHSRHQYKKRLYAIASRGTGPACPLSLLGMSVGPLTCTHEAAPFHNSVLTRLHRGKPNHAAECSWSGTRSVRP